MSEVEKQGAGLTQEPPPHGVKLQGSQLAVALLLAVVGLFYSLTPLWHTDVWGHLRYGAWILEQRSLPATEPFCEFADKDTPLVHFAWGSQLVFVGTFRLGAWLTGGDDMRQLEGGVAALRTLTVLLALLFCWHLLLACWRASGSLALAVLGLLLYQLLAPTALGVLRPQLFGMTLFAVLLAQLSRERWSWLDVALTAPLFLLWANLHGSFVVGLGLFGIFLLGRFLSLCRSAESFSFAAPFRDPHFLRLTFGLCVGVVAASINPYGPDLFRIVAVFGRNPVISRYFDEAQPLSLTLGPGALYWYIGSLVVLLGSWVMGRKWPSATQMLIVLAFGLAPISQRRLLMWWMPLVVWLVVPSWAELARRRGWSWVNEETPSLANTLLVCLLLFASLLSLPSARALLFGQESLSKSVTAATPWRLTRHLNGQADPSLQRLTSALRNYPQGKFQGTVFTTEATGDFLLWDLPQHQVVAYSHGHAFPLEHWKAVMAVKSGEPGWDKWLDRWGVNLVVVDSAGNPGLLRAIGNDRSRWQVVLDATELKGSRRVPDWLFVAIRKKPIEQRESGGEGRDP